MSISNSKHSIKHSFLSINFENFSFFWETENDMSSDSTHEQTRYLQQRINPNLDGEKNK